MPSENNHYCDIHPSGNYTNITTLTFHSKTYNKDYKARKGTHKKTGKVEVFTHIYAKDVWPVKQARAHCVKHGGSFEAATKEVVTEIRYADIASGELREVTEEEKATGILKPVLSSSVKDAHGTRVWNKPTRYKDVDYKPAFWRGQTSVPILYKHGRDWNYGDKEMGRWKGFKAEEDGKLVGDPLVFDLKDAFAAERFRKHVDRFADSWSIAFYPTLELSGDDANAFYKEQGIEEDGASVYLAPQYVEVSDVTFGSNPDAHDKDILIKEFKELISRDCVPREDFDKLAQRITELEALINGDMPKGIEALRSLAKRLKGVIR